MEEPSENSNDLYFFMGGVQIGKLIRARDWNKTTCAVLW